MKKPYFGRLLTAMVTPFDESGVNVEAVKKLVDWWLAHGTDGLVVTGSTGEAATMSVEEKKLLWTTVVQYVDGRVPVIAGTGSNSTAGSIEMTKLAESCGVDGVLIVGPYYNKPTQEGYYRHFKAIADSTSCKVILYNVPGRTAANVASATVARTAAACPNVVAIKEAAGRVDQVAELYRLLPEDFTIYSGDDGLILPFLSVGASGLISVLSNVDGEILQNLMQAYEEGRVKEAADLNKKMVPLAEAMFVETNPIPVKKAVSLVTGIDCGDPRLPLTPLSEGALAKMTAVLRENGLLP
ncbi:MAG: 4-hydroxy-tetrahydrodipicolinate synthase [Succiniclasticum sp.]|nr:4-hydroxy-tetrahydrodipicolinate synthase [Succiniclasticum sp.]